MQCIERDCGDISFEDLAKVHARLLVLHTRGCRCKCIERVAGLHVPEFTGVVDGGSGIE